MVRNSDQRVTTSVFKEYTPSASKHVANTVAENSTALLPASNNQASVKQLWNSMMNIICTARDHFMSSSAKIVQQ